MSKKPVLLFLIGVVVITPALFSVGEITNISSINLKATPANRLPSSQPLVDKSPVTLIQIDKWVIYSSVIQQVIDDDFFDKVPGGLEPTDQLVYRRETISPSGIDQIESNQEIPESLIHTFKNANQQSAILDKQYSIPAPVTTFSGNRDLAVFYETAKRKDSFTKAVVGFSNLGIDESYSQALVYVEYYKPRQGLIKFYYLMEMEKQKYTRKTGDSSTNQGSFSNVKNFKRFQVIENQELGR